MTNRNIRHTNPGHVFNAYVTRVLLFNANNGKIRFKYGVKFEQKIRASTLLQP